MNRTVALLLFSVALVGCTQPRESRPVASAAEVASWEARARSVTITRDDWGIPHVHGKTDADAVFALIYAQAEDDFNRIETNYLLSQGWLAEAEGEEEIWRDLRMKLFVDPAGMQEQYRSSPDWLKALMNAWADGLNFYLHTHPQVQPRVIRRFEPWMALTFSEGSIGGDIERISLKELQAFYEGREPVMATTANASGLLELEPTGSNGFAIAPSLSASRHPLLWINPHTSFFFRAEAQATSDEGLNAYGALTWGQFFVYQGFNERAGWMHTSSGVDNIDEYLETVQRRGDGYVYRYGNEDRPVEMRRIVVPFRTPSGMRERQFTVYATHHGPVVRSIEGKWVSVRLMQEPVKALMQSYLRTKATTLEQFIESMRLHANSSNNTVFADASGNIAYLHANFVPRRDPRFDWTKPVDGSDPATEWRDLHTVEESPNVINPPNGWLYNTNNPPWTAAGENSPKQTDYPAYMDASSQNPRGVHALRVLTAGSSFTPQTLTAAAFDSQLPAFEPLVPQLIAGHDRLPAASTLKARLQEPIDTLRDWDYRWSAESVATTLAVTWGEELWTRFSPDAGQSNMSVYEYLETRLDDEQRLAALDAVVAKLAAEFGRWQVPWGDINRFQRLTGDIEQPFSDAGPSIPVPFTSARWGSLATFGARSYKGSKKIYGTTGNSFLAVVEFGEKVKARAITAGGQSGDPRSRHFNDQAERYARGDLREVYFYPQQLRGHTERTYHPGE